MPLESGELTIGDVVIDTFRKELYGDTKGSVTSAMGPYRVFVKWPDERGERLEKISDLELIPNLPPSPRNCDCGIGNLWPHPGHSETCAYRVDLQLMKGNS